MDSKTGLIHTVASTAANVHDSTVPEDLLHGDETRVWGDQAYRGQREVIRRCRIKGVIDEAEKPKTGASPRSAPGTNTDSA